MKLSTVLIVMACVFFCAAFAGGGFGCLAISAGTFMLADFVIRHDDNDPNPAT
jgi:hypothetical protein